MVCDYLNVFVRTIGRDVTALSRFMKVQKCVNNFQRNSLTVPLVFEQVVQKHPDKACVIFENTVWTFKMISDLSNKIAQIFEKAGFKPGDTVALVMDNRPEYVAIWLGLAKAGILIALINYNLKGNPLAHSISIVESKAVIFGADFAGNVADIRDRLDQSITFFSFKMEHNSPDWCRNLDTALAESSSQPLEGAPRSSPNDKLLYIYTSGTTGLPKAAVIRHSKFMYFVSGVHFITKMSSDDIMYDTLPLYHSAGGMTALGQALIFGMTVVIRKKFSASAFWTEAVQHNCTVAIYIGEICRYLLTTPTRPEERNHKIRLMYGNGLRPQIWEEFVNRFNIPLICELYGATESIANVMNFEGVVGAVGFIPLNFPRFYPVALIKVDENGEPIRDKNGFCIRCKPREPGMFVGLIDKGNPIRNFDGYADRNATKKKVARDVFKRGDAAFLSGDILEMDEMGYLFFKDRTGDTFRWRGENVSTTEVEAVISNVAGLKDCVVYGVEVPGSEGRAGMAAIMDPDRSLDLAALASGISEVLPSYARPLFIRTIASIELTGTYKLRKVDYQKEGFDIGVVKDDIYFLDPSSQTYVPFTVLLYDKLKAGAMRI